MDRPIRFLLLLGAVLCGRGVGLAQDAAAGAAPGEDAAPPKRARAISPRVAALLAAAAPKFEAPKPAEAKPGIRAADKPANEIIRLPDYIVREPRLPTPEQVMTRKALESYAMNHYLGPENGFDRGFLNLFTLAQLWQKIPLIGRFIPAPFGSITNEERAMLFYAEDERLRKMNDLLELATLTEKSGAAAGGEGLRREIERTFLRDPGPPR